MNLPPRIPFVKPSSLRFFREGRTMPGYSLYDWLHGYLYARWTYLYIGIGVGEHPLVKKFGPFLGPLLLHFSRSNGENGAVLGEEPPNEALVDGRDGRITFADTYHGKVVPFESARRLVTVNEDICLPNLEQVIPYKKATDIILKNPDHIAVLQCPCRSARPDPCLPLEVCLVIGEPFASFVIEHHPQRARWITQEEAVQILKEEDERGHAHHAFFKDAMLGRFYAICNCCACCCGAMQAHRHGTPMLASSGYVSEVDDDLCLGCGVCAEACQFGALSLVDYRVFVDEALCMGCGVCIERCEQGALSLRLEPLKGEPLEILELMAKAGLEAREI